VKKEITVDKKVQFIKGRSDLIARKMLTVQERLNIFIADLVAHGATVSYSSGSHSNSKSIDPDYLKRFKEYRPFSNKKR
jgi:hypothetical protein